MHVHRADFALKDVISNSCVAVWRRKWAVIQLFVYVAGSGSKTAGL